MGTDEVSSSPVCSLIKKDVRVFSALFILASIGLSVFLRFHSPCSTFLQSASHPCPEGVVCKGSTYFFSRLTQSSRCLVFGACFSCSVRFVNSPRPDTGRLFTLACRNSSLSSDFCEGISRGEGELSARFMSWFFWTLTCFFFPPLFFSSCGSVWCIS